MIQGVEANEEEVIETRKQLTQRLTGAMNTRRQTPPPPARRGPAPPSWWTDDDNASEDNFRAMNELAQLRG